MEDIEHLESWRMTVLIPWLGAPTTLRPRLIIADHESTYAHAVARIMRTVEVEVEITHSIPATIQAIASVRPRLVLLDALLLGLDPSATMAKIRRTPSGSSARVVLCSALDEAELIEWTVTCDADGCIPKSVGPVELRNRLVEWLISRPGSRPHGVHTSGWGQ